MKDLKPLNEDSGKLFEAYGMTEEEFWNMPYKELWKLMNGRPTGVTPCGRLSIVRKEDGRQVGVITPPCPTDAPTLSVKEMAVLKEQGVIYKELNHDGERNRSFVQLDSETNYLMVEKADDVGQYFPISIFKITLTRGERDQMREGKTVVVSDGEKKYEIKVDLTRRAGFSVKRV